jgi:hypothetical protein
VPARAWAETLDLDDPAGLGARRVSDALQWLARSQFVRLESRRGSPPAVTLLRFPAARYSTRGIQGELGIAWDCQWPLLLLG